MQGIRTRSVFALSVAALIAASCGSDDDESLPACPNASSTLTYTSFGKDFLDSYCAPCHAASVTGAARMGAPDEDVFDTLEQVQADKGELYEQVVSEKKMPYKTTTHQPTDAERASFGEWLACGAK